MSAKCYAVGEAARLAHVTVRTLHHYDELGLLVPSARSEAGYRLYAQADLERLHEILLFRELGFSLEAIRGLLDEPPRDRREALEAQRAVLMERVRKTHAVIRAVDAALEALKGDGPMDTTKLFEGFGEFDHAKYEDEARQRWGETEAYKESARRTKRYKAQDWAAIQAEGNDILTAFARLMAEGKKPTEDEAADVAERHRLHIGRWFYPCDHAMHEGLGEMYLADPRFAAFFEKQASGLTEYVVAAIRANGERSRR